MKILLIILLTLQITPKSPEFTKFPYALPGCAPKLFKNIFQTKVFINFSKACKNLENCFTDVNSPKEVCKGMFYDSMDEFCYGNSSGKEREFCYRIVDENIVILDRAIEEFLRSENQFEQIRGEKRVEVNELNFENGNSENNRGNFVDQILNGNNKFVLEENFSNPKNNVNFVDKLLNNPVAINDNLNIGNFSNSSIKVFNKNKLDNLKKNLRPFFVKVNSVEKNSENCDDEELEKLKVKWETSYFEYFEVKYQNKFCFGKNSEVKNNFIQETLNDLKSGCNSKLMPFKKLYKIGIEKELNRYWRNMCSKKNLNKIFKKEIKKINPQLLTKKLKNNPINKIINNAKDLFKTLLIDNPINKSNNENNLNVKNKSNIQISKLSKLPKLKIKLKFSHRGNPTTLLKKILHPNLLNNILNPNLLKKITNQNSEKTEEEFTTNISDQNSIKMISKNLENNLPNFSENVLQNNLPNFSQNLLLKNLSLNNQNPKIIYVPVPVQTNPFMNFMTPQIFYRNNLNNPFSRFGLARSYFNMQNGASNFFGTNNPNFVFL